MRAMQALSRDRPRVPVVGHAHGEEFVIGRLPDGGAFIACRMRSATKRCWPCAKAGRKREALALCDGPRPPASRATTSTCDMPICEEHRTRVGPGRDLCPG